MALSVRPISQIFLHVGSGGEADLFKKVRKVILKWIEPRAGAALSAKAWQGDSFMLDGIGTQRTEAVVLPDKRLWAARLDDADKNVARRSWVTEVVIHEEQDGTVRLGCRLQCVMRDADVAFERSIPGFVSDIVQHNTVKLDGKPISLEPWFIDRKDQVQELIKLLRAPHRRGDVIVFSLPEDSTSQDETAASAPEVARRTSGAAHVAVISGPAGYYLSDLVGEGFSVYRRAIRTYRPGFDPTTDEPFLHPRRLESQIAEWQDEGPKAYERLLISQALLRSVSSRDIERELPPFPELRRIAADLERKKDRQEVSSQEDLLQLAESEIRELRDERAKMKDEYNGLLVVAEQERDSAQEDYERARNRNIHLQNRVRQLEQQLAQSNQSMEPPIPNNLDGFEKWCQENLSGSVELHNRAFTGVKKSQYEDKSLLYKALLLLRDYYVPMRREGGDKKKDDFKKACQKLGIEEAQAISETGKGEEGDTYIVRHSGKKCVLKRHLRKGNAHDERYCFRLYFFWDDENEYVVVGWLPSHLDTRAT